MDQRAIGVFDSGLGGLTALRELTALLPHEHIIYFGDTARVPYGTRSRETIINYARQDVSFLRSFDLKAILIACGTVSTTAMETLGAEFSTPLFGVVEPAVAQAVAASVSGRIGLIGTPATVGSGAFERAILAHNSTAHVTSAACPLFVPLVENGRYEPDDKVVELVVAEYLQPLKAAGVDTLVLGCTHYPLLAEAIAAYMGEGVRLINTGAAAAQALAGFLREGDVLSDATARGEQKFYVSDSPEGFERLASIFLHTDVCGEVAQVTVG